MSRPILFLAWASLYAYRTVKRAKRWLAICFGLAFLASACAASFDAPYAEPPCGYHGVSCGGGMCCDEQDVCGGPLAPSCPAGMCCFVGDERVMRANRPQRFARP